MFSAAKEFLSYTVVAHFDMFFFASDFAPYTQGAVGFNLASAAGRNDTITRARRLGQTQATPPIELVQEVGLARHEHTICQKVVTRNDGCAGRLVACLSVPATNTPDHHRSNN